MVDSPERRIRLLAARQHGVITRRQALACGLTDRMVDSRVAAHRWRLLKPGVYFLGLATGPQALLAAAAAYLPAVVSHASAAKLHGFLIGRVGRPTVTVPHRATNRFPGVRVHESTDLTPEFVVTIDGLPVTSPVRTVVDLAAVLSTASLERLAHSCLAERRFSTDDLAGTVNRLGRRGKRGFAGLRALVSDLTGDDLPVESELERRFIELIAATDLPPPVRQMPLPWRQAATGRVDFAWPRDRLLVECDGRRWHSTHVAFETDRRRDNLAQLAGWRVLRFTWDDITQRPDEVVRVMRRGLRLMRAGSASGVGAVR